MRDTSSKWLAKRVGFALSLHLWQMLGSDGRCLRRWRGRCGYHAGLSDSTERIWCSAEGIGMRLAANPCPSTRRLAGRSAAAGLGVRTPMVDEIGQRLKQSHNLPRRNLAVTFTHSHCAPKVNGASDNIFSSAISVDHQKHIDRYTMELADNITTAVRNAMDARKPARLEWAVGKVGFAENRRMVGGPVDHDLPTLVVRYPKTRKPRAICVSYACHCVTLSFNKISGDWAGYAATMIERRVRCQPVSDADGEVRYPV